MKAEKNTAKTGTKRVTRFVLKMEEAEAAAAEGDDAI